MGLLLVGLLVAFASSPAAAPVASRATAPTEPTTTSLAVRAPVTAVVTSRTDADIPATAQALSDATAGAKHVLTEANKGETVKLKVGEKMAIRLVENKTTGFGWALEDRADPTKQGVSAVPATLELVHDKSRKSIARGPTGRPLVGAPGEHVFVLKASRAGTTPLCAAYRRPWLPVSSTDPAQLYCLTVEVTN